MDHLLSRLFGGDCEPVPSIFMEERGAVTLLLAYVVIDVIEIWIGSLRKHVVRASGFGKTCFVKEV